MLGTFLPGSKGHLETVPAGLMVAMIQMVPLALMASAEVRPQAENADIAAGQSEPLESVSLKWLSHSFCWQ